MDTDSCEHCGGGGIVYNMDGGAWICPCPEGAREAKRVRFDITPRVRFDITPVVCLTP